MKTPKRRVLSFGAILIMFAVFMGSFSSIVKSDPSYITLTIIDANYSNLDFDEYEDDIQVKAILDSNFEADILFFLFLDIVLPSGFVYRFDFQIATHIDGSQLLLTIKTFDTAIESGWYDCVLTGIVIHDDMMLFSESMCTFDPPTERGPGEPTATISISVFN